MIHSLVVTVTMLHLLEIKGASSPVVFSVPRMAPDRHTSDAQQMSDEIVNECIENIAMCARSDFEGGAGTGEIIDNLKRLSI